MENDLVSLSSSGLPEKCEIFNQRVLLTRILGGMNLTKERHLHSVIVDDDDDDDDDNDDDDNNRVRSTGIVKLSITGYAYLVHNDVPILLGLHCFAVNSSCTSDTIP